jgi:predicted 2-oxoglutarate/Fe(II)-dependent dioxygenase YbiX
MIQELVDNNFLVVRNFISAERSKKLSEEFKKYCEDNNISDDSQIPNTPAQYNYKSFLELLCEKTPEISKVIKETVVPTYCYARVYKNGDILTKHTDRDACDISLTVHLDGDEEWTIYVQSPDKKEIPVNLKCGDALVYLGCDAPHWRNAFDGSFYSQVFLHYVRSRGERSYAYFDKVKSNTDTNSQIKLSSKLESFIQIYENVIPEDLCDSIINQYQNDNGWEDSRVGGGIDSKVNKKVRNCQIMSISSQNTISKNHLIRKELDDKVFEVASFIINDLKTKFETITINQDSGYDLLKYTTGGFYTQHTDSFTDNPRAISCSLILNDDYEGGEFGFFDREVVYKLKKGSAITFPSNFLYPHEIMPVTSGTRYSIITWFV